MTERRLPLGIDVGASRIRAASLAQRADGHLRLLDVAAVDVDDSPLAALQSVLRGLHTRERRCVLAVPAPDAALRRVAFPPMSRRERERAARFEIDRPAVEPLSIRCIEDGGGETLVTAASLKQIGALRALANRAGLVPFAVDHGAFAALRLGPGALLDVGRERTVLIVRHPHGPFVREFAIGGETFTTALARDYGVSRDEAELRKRTLGLTGAAREPLMHFGREAARVLLALRAEHGVDVTDLVLVGNGSRLGDLTEALRCAGGVACAPLDLSRSFEHQLPHGVVQAAGPDWWLAIGLATYAARPVRAA